MTRSLNYFWQNPPRGLQFSPGLVFGTEEYVKYPQWTASTTYDSGETSVADSSGRYYFVYYIFPTGLFFARFKKTQSRKKLAQKKNSRQNFAKKNSKYRSHLNISPKKLRIFSLSGTYFDRF